MHLIKLNATASTNSYLKELYLTKKVVDFTTVQAKEQSNGRGQMGTSWQSDAGKNLTFSVLKLHDNVKVQCQFSLTMLVSNVVLSVLREFNIPDIAIKWPNDIMAGNRKICGILIENMVSGIQLQASVIGIGLNVNQLKFKALPKVTSMKLETGTHFNLDELLVVLVQRLKEFFETFEKDANTFVSLKQPYESALFRKNKPSTFKAADGSLFMGFIQEVSHDGKLVVRLEDEIVKEFDLKQLQLLY